MFKKKKGKSTTLGQTPRITTGVGAKKSTALKKIKIKEKKKPIVKLNDTNSLIEYALKNKSGIESLKEILKMKHEEEARESERLFHINFCEMQAEFPVIPKTQKVNTRTGDKMYAYANMPAIVPIVGPIIAKHGFAYRWTKEFPNEKQIKIIFHFTGYGHTETCSMILPIMQSNNFVNAIQQSGSTSTYGERYTFCGMLGIVSDEDDDGRGSSTQAPAQNQKQPNPSAADLNNLGEQKKKKPEVIPPVKPILPSPIKSTDICKLGNYKDVPLKYNKVSLNHLLAFQTQAANPEALSTVIHETIDKRVTEYKEKLGYKDADLKAMIKLDIKKDVEYIDLDQAEKLIVFRNLKNIIAKLGEKK